MQRAREVAMGPWEKRKGMSFQYKDKAKYKEDSVCVGGGQGSWRLFTREQRGELEE